MLQKLRDIFCPKLEPKLPSVPAGTRYYVIGAIHGRLDLYEALIAAIEVDDRKAAPADTRIVLLGDLVDRGPDSAGVLAGNHEEMFLNAFETPEALRHFLKHGGRETVLSYGLSTKQFATLDLEEMFALLPRLVPEAERKYIATFETMIRAGDYVFVHAGIDPTRPLAEQKRSDLLWIRGRFLSHEGPLEKVVVHGHTIFERVMDCGNRIGIDTGAFRSGVLTALVLEGDHRRIIQACRANGGPVKIFHGDRAR